MRETFNGANVRRPCSLSAALRLASEATAQMRRSERLARRAESHGAQKAALRFRRDCADCAKASAYWLDIVQQHVVSGYALHNPF